MFCTEASKYENGNYNLRSSCTNGHTVYKDQMHPDGPYRCPYCDHDVY